MICDAKIGIPLYSYNYSPIILTSRIIDANDVVGGEKYDKND